MTLYQVVGLALAAVLGGSGLLKVLAPKRFRSALATTYGIKGRLGLAATIAVPATEMACAGLLLWPATTGWGYLMAFVFLATALGVVGQAWARARRATVGASELRPKSRCQDGRSCAWPSSRS